VSDGSRDPLLPWIGGGRGALRFGERSGGGERAAVERDGGGAGRVEAVAGGRLAPAVVTALYYRVRVWEGGRFLTAGRIRGLRGDEGTVAVTGG
jgi:hypothetical protein